jgi:hypothetical protein
MLGMWECFDVLRGDQVALGALFGSSLRWMGW